MSRKFEMEYEELLRLSENAGVSDVMKFFGEYEEYFNENKEFLRLITPETEFSTTNFTHMDK